MSDTTTTTFDDAVLVGSVTMAILVLTGVLWRSLRSSEKTSAGSAPSSKQSELSAADSKAELESVIAACTAKGLDVLTLTCINDAANSFGMGFGNLGAVRPGHKLVVRNLRKDGIAAKAGVCIGDALLGIDGMSTPRSQEGMFERLRKLPDGANVELVVAREKEEEEEDDESMTSR